MRALLSVARVLLTATAAVVALALFMLVLAAVLRLVAPDRGRFADDNLPAWEAGVFAWAWSLAPALDREAADARLDNDPLRNWGETCNVFKLHGDDAELLVPEFSALSRLGNGLYTERVALAKQVNWGALVIRATTLATIVLGFCATVLVALANGEFKNDETSTGRWVRRLAVVAPALVTAVASYAAFEAPRNEVLRLAQVLPAQQKLHRDVGAGLRTIACPETPEERQKVLGRIAQWTSQWQELRFDPNMLRLLTNAKGGGLPGAPDG